MQLKIYKWSQSLRTHYPGLIKCPFLANFALKCPFLEQFLCPFKWAKSHTSTGHHKTNQPISTCVIIIPTQYSAHISAHHNILGGWYLMSHNSYQPSLNVMPIQHSTHSQHVMIMVSGFDKIESTFYQHSAHSTFYPLSVNSQLVVI